MKKNIRASQIGTIRRVLPNEIQSKKICTAECVEKTDIFKDMYFVFRYFTPYDQQEFIDKVNDFIQFQKQLISDFQLPTSKSLKSRTMALICRNKKKVNDATRISVKKMPVNANDNK